MDAKSPMWLLSHDEFATIKSINVTSCFPAVWDRWLMDKLMHEHEEHYSANTGISSNVLAI